MYIFIGFNFTSVLLYIQLYQCNCTLLLMCVIAATKPCFSTCVLPFDIIVIKTPHILVFWF